MQVFYKWGVAAYFPQAIAHRAEQAVTVTAGTLEQAATAGLRALRKRDGIKGRHLTEARLTITRMGIAPDQRGQLPLVPGN